MTQVIYKSKNIDYMNKLKKAVLTGMRGSMPEEKEYTWNYVQKQVMLDDTQSFLVSKLGRMVTFPTKNFNGDVMAIFNHEPTKEELDILNKMMKARTIGEGKVYVTWLNKAETFSPEEADVLRNVLNAEISVINPKIVMSFGVPFTTNQHTVVDFKSAKLIDTYDMKWLFNAEDENDIARRKQALWNDVVELTKHYIN